MLIVKGFEARRSEIPRSIRQMSVHAQSLGSLLAEIKLVDNLCFW